MVPPNRKEKVRSSVGVTRGRVEKGGGEKCGSKKGGSKKGGGEKCGSKKGGSKKGDPGEENKGPFQKFHRAFISSFVWWLALLPLALIPVVGPLMVVTAVPFYAGRRGSRWVEKKYAVESICLVAVCVSVVQTVTFYLLLGSFSSGTVLEVQTGNAGAAILGLIYLSNFMFSIMGSITCNRKYYLEPPASETKEVSSSHRFRY